MVRFAPGSAGFRPLEDDPHSHAQKGCCIRFDSIRGMNGHFYVRAKIHALGEPKAVKRFENAFIMLPRVIWFSVVKCNTEHVSAASKGVYLSQPKLLFLLDGCSRIGGERKPPKRRPAVAKFMLEAKASPISTAQSFRVVAPQIEAIIPVMITGRA
jgi:hypothetical protein